MNLELNEDKNYDINDPKRYNFSHSGDPLIKPKKEYYNEMYISVHDTNGALIRKYNGRFAIIEQTANKIEFEDENKKRHLIIISSGMIIVDQK